MVTRDDVFIALSNSGESDGAARDRPADETPRRQADRADRQTRESSLAQQADVHLYAGAEKEACPLNLAPDREHHRGARDRATPSRWRCMHAQGCSAATNSRARIPAARSAGSLLTHVRDVMRDGATRRACPGTAMFPPRMLEMSRGRMGMTAVIDDGQPGDRYLHRRRPAARAARKAWTCTTP